MRPVQGDDRARLWLDLLSGLTQRVPDWGVWKNAESALYGIGDVDSCAPRSAWPAIESEFLGWASGAGLTPVTTCRHIPQTMNIVAVPPEWPTFLQLEVKGEGTFRGSRLFRAEDLRPAMIIDPAGFRRLRPGAEGVFKFITNGVLRGGLPYPKGLESKGVRHLLSSDPGGVAQISRIFGKSRRPLLRAIDAYLEGGWDRRAVLEVEGIALARSLRQPDVFAERAFFRLVTKRSCPLLKAVYRADRRVPEPSQIWMREVAATHPVHEGAQG